MSCKSAPTFAATSSFPVDVFAARLTNAGGWIGRRLRLLRITRSACALSADSDPRTGLNPTCSSDLELNVADALAQLPAALAYHLYTLFLFTKSDFKTTVFPITVLAAASTPLGEHSLPRLLHVLFWVWLHVLQFDVSNQTQDPAEDAHNKRDRPLPACRIALPSAVRLRWALVPLCWLLSACYSRETLGASVTLVALTVLYDELGAHAGHWLTRNAVNAAGFASFEVGASLISGVNRHCLDSAAQLGILLSAGIFISTIQAQDFKDTEGDSLVGRRTLPIVHPTLARPTLALLLLSWSTALALLWQLDLRVALPFGLLGTAVATCFLLARGVKADQRAFYLYNLWLSFAHILPIFWRLHAATA